MRISDWSSDVCSSDLNCSVIDLKIAVLTALRAARAARTSWVNPGSSNFCRTSSSMRTLMMSSNSCLVDAASRATCSSQDQSVSTNTRKIGRESSRERGGQKVSNLVVAVYLKKKKK